jgi:DnaK suppressor protein
MGLSKKQIGMLTDKIQAERERVLNKIEINSEENFHLQQEDRSDEIDQATSDYERSQMLRFRNRDIFYAKKLAKALVSMANNEYGTCDECDCDIKFERLLARPTAEMCISCKDESEREEQGNFVGRQSKSIGGNTGAVKSL